MAVYGRVKRPRDNRTTSVADDLFGARQPYIASLSSRKRRSVSPRDIGLSDVADDLADLFRPDEGYCHHPDGEGEDREREQISRFCAEQQSRFRRRAQPGLSRDQDRRRRLLDRIRNGDTAAVQYLLDKRGAEPHFFNEDGESPLSLAITANSLDSSLNIVSLLLERGVDPNTSHSVDKDVHESEVSSPIDLVNTR